MYILPGFKSSSKKVLYQAVLAIAAAGLILAQPGFAQSSGFASSGIVRSTAEPPASPTNIPPPSKAKLKHEKLVREPSVPSDKRINAKVTSGMLVVDGLVTKVRLNYDIHHAGYLYFFLPGQGTIVVSEAKLPMLDAVKMKDVIQGAGGELSLIAFQIDGHSFELTSEMPTDSSLKTKIETKIKGGDHASRDAYVWMDRNTTALSRAPQFGYGNTLHAPYVWPLSGAEGKDTYAHYVEPPPLPPNMLPKTKATLVAASDIKP